jgi:site-specific DNA recombinase
MKFAKNKLRDAIRCAIYARISTDMQREESIEDQFRECERLAKAQGFEVVARFQDIGISGGTTSRPGYQALLTAARADQFEVIVTEDISRLWRNRAEFGPRSAELEDLGIDWVSCVGQDTRRDGWGLVISILGAMAEYARKEASYRTRRGLEGLAKAGKPTGRKPYGYIPASKSETKTFEINHEQAAVVERIFKLYVDGYSPRAIATMLNNEGVPSPKANTKFKKYRNLGWRGSAIAGCAKRRMGILNNEIYCGEVNWGVSRWPQSAADSENRTRLEVPEDEWTYHHDESLRIISDELWNSVKERQTGITKLIGDRISKGIAKSAATRTGAGPKYLLSGLLQCSYCRSNYVICGRDVYGCAANKNGGSTMCSNDARIRRQAAENEVLLGITLELLTPEAIEAICSEVRALLRKPKPPAVNNAAQIKLLRAQIDNLTDAIANGVMRPSVALSARLSEAEMELARLERGQRESEAATRAPELLLADLTERATRAVGSLRETLSKGDIAKSRQEIGEYIGKLTVEADEQEIRLYSNKLHAVTRLLRASNAPANLYGSGGRI